MQTLDILKAESEPDAGDVGVRIRTGLVSAAWVGLRSYAGFYECAGHVTEFDIEVLRCPSEQVEGLIGGNTVAFHEDALGLADQFPGSQRSADVFDVKLVDFMG